MKKISLIFLISLLAESLAFAQTKIEVQDTRSSSTTPASYSRSLEPHFKWGPSLGLPNMYYTVLGLRGWTDNSGGKSFELAFSTDGNLLLRSGFEPTWEAWRQLLLSDANGNVGIGTDAPQEKLSVNGKIRAKEIKVETANWPDYVFGKEYKLPNLKETETFIKANGHLPGVPSATVAEKEGIELGEMNKVLLKKIEELTLHLIEKDKEIQALRKLEERLAKLEKALKQ